MPRVENAWASGGRLIDGRFELLARLGAGGMGTVWWARDTLLDREVALKEVSFGGAAAFDQSGAHVLRERTLREARALARLGHPNVVTIYHVVDSPEVRYPWLVMELISGGSLKDRLDRGPLPPAEAVRIGRGVLAALRAAHAANIQHRDVKPANVLLRQDGTPVLTDFGIAALRGSAGLTATDSLIGSPEYIAPERIRGQEGDPASDLWSLALMLYVAVEGYHPLSRESAMATLAAVLDASIPPPAHAGPLGPVLGAVLARDPSARPDGAALDGMLAAVEHALLGPGPMIESHSIESVYSRSADANPAHINPAHIKPASMNPALPRAGRRAAKRRSAPFVAGVSAVAVLGLIGALLWTLNGSHGSFARGGGAESSAPVTRSPGGIAGLTGVNPATIPAPSGQTQNLLTPASVRSAISALRVATGGSKVKTLVVMSNLITAQAPPKNNPAVYDNFNYQGGAATDFSAGEPLKADDVLFDPSVLDWNAMPALLRDAAAELGIAHPTNRYVIAQGDFPGASPAMLVFVADPYGNAFLVADSHGKVIKTFPRTAATPSG